MSEDQRIKLITKNLEETLTENELKTLLEKNVPLVHYIGFEISGKVHLGQGLFTMMKIRDLQQAGVHTKILLADWHTWLNKKLDGTLATAKRLAREYFQQAMIASALCVGADPQKIEFVLGSDLYEKWGSEYWAMMVNVSKATTLARMMRSTTIMGRTESEISDSAMLIYPAMQSADIFALEVNLAHAGTDQRNVHVVARDAATTLGKTKPVAIHHHLLQGLSKPAIWPIPEDNREEAIIAMKMSKSKPDSAIFITDSPEEIRRKIYQAFAPEGEIKFNPILDWTRFLIFYDQSSSLTIKRDQKYGGETIYHAYPDLEKDYLEKKLHPTDLKEAIGEWLVAKLEPARKYFEDPVRKKALEEIEQLTIKK